MWQSLHWMKRLPATQGNQLKKHLWNISRKTNFRVEDKIFKTSRQKDQISHNGKGFRVAIDFSKSTCKTREPHFDKAQKKCALMILYEYKMFFKYQDYRKIKI